MKLQFTYQSSSRERAWITQYVVAVQSRNTATLPTLPTAHHYSNNTPFLHAVLRPRAFEVFSHPIPCNSIRPRWKLTKAKGQEAQTGILFLKPLKVGSTTGALGVLAETNVMEHNVTSMRRWNGRIGNNLGHTLLCETRCLHGPQRIVDPGSGTIIDGSAAYRLFPNRSRTDSFLWTIVQEPKRRVVSHFFHFMCRGDTRIRQMSVSLR